MILSTHLFLHIAITAIGITGNPSIYLGALSSQVAPIEMRKYAMNQAI